MHHQAPSVIAVSNNMVIGYALVATKAIRNQHPLLADLFNAIDKENFNQKPLATENYVVVGQLCVAKEFRGRGLVQQLYNYYRQSYSHQYSYLITDVVQNNQRSIKAHLKTGFQIISTLQYGGLQWSIVLWDWSNS
jgi:predicted GNAT superfamily acetyltransferase